MTRQQLFSEMDAHEFGKWMAYKMLQNEDVRNRLLKEIAIEKSAKQDIAQRRKALRDMFMGLKYGTDK